MIEPKEFYRKPDSLLNKINTVESGTDFLLNIMVYHNEITELESTGLVLGALPEIDIRRAYINIYPDSVLVLYSDGIVERQNNSGEEFGLALLKDFIIKHKDKDAEEILTEIFLTANEFGNKRKWNDDATVVVIKKIV